jgi:hypothetical protein
MSVVSDSPDTQAAAADAWRVLAQAGTTEQFFSGWLEVLCRSLADARAGLVLLAHPDGSYAPVAALPAARDLSYLSDIATEALRQREGVVRHDQLGHARLAYPLISQERLHGAVVLDLGAVQPAALERALRLTHWGAGWLVDLLHQQDLQQFQLRQQQGRFLLDTLLGLMNEPSLREKAMALVNRLGREFDSPQVQLGLARRKTIRVLAVSHAAWFDERTEAVDLAAHAMHESLDQRQRLHWPADRDDATRVVSAHQRYAEASRAVALLSLPLASATQVVGVLMLERDRPFEAQEIEFLETLALALAPVIELGREAERGVFGRLARQLQRGAGWLSSSSHPAIKLGLGAAALLLLALALVPVDYRVSAPALVEGAVQRAAVAPFEGYLREAPARAGDTVKAGQLLAVLDDKDLQLERVRWESELERRAAQGARGHGRGQPCRPAPGRGAGQSGACAARPRARPAGARAGDGTVRRRRRQGRPVANAGLAGGAGQGAVRTGAAGRLARRARGR